MELALVALLVGGVKLRIPRIWPLLALFIAGTLLAVVFSLEPAAAWPQIKKLYVFSMLVVVFTALRDMTLVRRVFLAWIGIAAASGVLGIVQFIQKLGMARRLGADLYQFYVGSRITGFMSHWNTFSAEEMYVLIMLCSFLFFGIVDWKRAWIWMSCGVIIGSAVVLAETRAVWIGLSIGILYLVWNWRRWLVLVAPVLAAVAFLAAPPVIRERITSIVHPHEGYIDSNSFREVTRRTGLRMVKAHPWLGLGPEMPRKHFDEWMPPDIVEKPIGAYVHLHNVYLDYAAERGIPTLLAMLAMLATMVWNFFRGLHNLPPGRSDRRFVLHGAIAVVIATMIEGVAEYNLGDTEVLTMFLIVMACAYVALERSDELEPGR
jgi:O-antigen ligase